MINTKEKFNEVIASENVIKIRAFLENCIVWDAFNKKEIEEYVERLSNRTINGKPVFEKDNNIDLSKFEDTQEDLDNLYAESMLNYSKEKYLYRLKIANKLSKLNNSNTHISTQNKSTNIVGKTNQGEDLTISKKKLALATLMIGVGAIAVFIMIKKLK